VQDRIWIFGFRICLFVKKVVFKTRSTQETIRLGKTIGSRLAPGDVVALAGELGTGKTHLIKGLAAGAGVKKAFHVSSPSFTLIHEYAGKVPFYHVDLFRLKSEKDAEELGLEEYLQGRGLTAIEWADKIPSLLPPEILWVHLLYAGETSRYIEVVGKDIRYQRLVEEIVNLLKKEGFKEGKE
jgi:tRNA threonylcarbamoyladenosine biosynthesis protein TsaE